MTNENSQEYVKYKPGQHPNSKKNLVPFPKGHPATNIRGYSLTAALRDTLRDKKLRRKLIESTLEGALKREPTPFREVWDRVDGRLQDNPPQVQGVTVVNILVTGEHMKELLAKVAERTGELLPAGRETPIAEAGETEPEG